MKRLLSFLIILALVVFVGFKAGAWWLADQRLAEARTALSEIGVLQRGNISSALDGRLLLKQAGWQDFRLTQPLELGLVELDTGRRRFDFGSLTSTRASGKEKGHGHKRDRQHEAGGIPRGVAGTHHPPKSSKATFSGGTPQSSHILRTAWFMSGGPQK